jgi:hypothetical protein
MQNKKPVGGHVNEVNVSAEPLARQATVDYGATGTEIA